MQTIYVNVNEEGEDYDSHRTLAAAQAVQAEFPNDTIEVRQVERCPHACPAWVVNGLCPHLSADEPTPEAPIHLSAAEASAWQMGWQAGRQA